MISGEEIAKPKVAAENVDAVRQMIVHELEDLKLRISEIQAGKLELVSQIEKDRFISSTVINKDEIIMALGCGIFVEMSAEESLKFIDARLADLRK